MTVITKVRHYGSNNLIIISTSENVSKAIDYFNFKNGHYINDTTIAP